MLKITEVRTATVVGNYYWTYVRVYSGERSGIGEGFFAPGLETVIKELSRLVIGEDALNINRIYDRLYWATVPSGVSGVNCHAVSAFEIALLDLVGRYLNVPVYTLLGGRYRENVRVYVDAHAGKSLEAVDPTLLPTVPKWMRELGVKGIEEEKSPVHGRASSQKFTDEFTGEAYASRAKEMVREGFTGVKFDLDVPTPYTKSYNRASGALTNREIRYLSDLVGAVREAVGEDIDLMFDLHWRFNVESSIRLAQAVEKYSVMWLEDPVPPSNLESLRLVASATKTPIATGENLYTRYGFLGLYESGVRTVTPDALKAGGLTETRFIAQMAALNEVTTSPHNISSPIGTVASAHLAASIPNFGILEFHGHDVPIWYRLSNREVIHKGFIELGDEPGLGVELDEKTASRYALNEKFEI